MSRGALLRDVAQIQDFDTLLKNAGARGNPDLVKGALTNAITKSLDTSGTTTLSSNLQEINLDTLVKHVYPIQTPALNMGLIGMTGGQVGDSRKYRAITDRKSVV